MNGARLARSAARWALFASGVTVGAAWVTIREGGLDYWRGQAARHAELLAEALDGPTSW